MARKDTLTIYLDHLIRRENLRYTRPHDALPETIDNTREKLALKDLLPDSTYINYLRKPDFQRATWAWTAEDCVSLLESIMERQVIPSIIMWTNPESGLDYILDGGHRVSVAMAWISNNWGYDSASKFDDPDLREQIRRNAKQVETVVNTRIGNIEDYRQAETLIDHIMDSGRSPMQEMDEKTYKRGRFYRDLSKGSVAFNILWVSGNYEIAERSFLKINKSGRQLSDWETLLIENRDSSFARTVMSVSSIASSEYYWPLPIDLEDSDSIGKVGAILKSVEILKTVLFMPKYVRPVRTLDQPYLVAEGENKPYYIAELFTIIEGYRGQAPETEVLMQKNVGASSKEIIDSGFEITTTATEVFSHLQGKSPKSLELVTALYFYSPDGRHVRSLLYGFIYWMFQGKPSDILRRKIAFSAFRGAFEFILFKDKSQIISRIGRKIGSGTEVTAQTASYFDALLRLIVKYQGEIESDDFLTEYSEYVSGIAGRKTSPESIVNVRSRIFTEKQKSEAVLDALFKQGLRCEITGGLIDPSSNLQHDHILPYTDGGLTVRENQRLTHPFTNNQRNAIELFKSESSSGSIPSFSVGRDPDKPYQLRLIDDDYFD